jgi:hypothetical protein
LQRFFRDDRKFGNLDVRVDRWSPGDLTFLAHAEQQNILAAVVQRYILPRLKESYFAHTFGRNPAGGEIRHATRFELQAHVGDVGLAGKNRETHGADFLDRRIHE